MLAHKCGLSPDFWSTCGHDVITKNGAKSEKGISQGFPWIFADFMLNEGQPRGQVPSKKRKDLEPFLKAMYRIAGTICFCAHLSNIGLLLYHVYTILNQLRP